MDSIKHLTDAITALRRAYDASGGYGTGHLVETAERDTWLALRAIVDEHIDEVSQ